MASLFKAFALFWQEIIVFTAALAMIISSIFFTESEVYQIQSQKAMYGIVAGVGKEHRGNEAKEGSQIDCVCPKLPNCPNR